MMQCCSIISKKKASGKNKLIKARAWSPVETIKVMASLLPIHSQPGKIKYPLCDIIIIIITRPKPAYGRQGLAGLWGQDTDEVSTFLVFLTNQKQ